MTKFYGQRTCTLDIKEFLPDSYHNITHKTIATILNEEDLLNETDTMQISTCHKYASICFKSREILLKYCNNVHQLLPDVPVTFSPDFYQRIRISIENLSTELPDIEVKNFLLSYATPIGSTYYAGQKHKSKFYTTGARVYQCIKLIQHLPRHLYEFGRYLFILYNSQPTPTPAITSNNSISENTPAPVY